MISTRDDGLGKDEAAPAAAAADAAEAGGGFWSGAGSVIGAAAGAAPGILSALQKPGKTIVKKGNTIVMQAPPKKPSAMPWVLGGLGAVLVLGVGAWLLIRSRKG
jgi:hypothetical protein